MFSLCPLLAQLDLECRCTLRGVTFLISPMSIRCFLLSLAGAFVLMAHSQHLNVGILVHSSRGYYHILSMSIGRQQELQQCSEINIYFPVAEFIRLHTQVPPRTIRWCHALERATLMKQLQKCTSLDIQAGRLGRLNTPHSQAARALVEARRTPQSAKLPRARGILQSPKPPRVRRALRNPKPPRAKKTAQSPKLPRARRTRQSPKVPRARRTR